jgi:hypothetical protein
MLVVFATLAVLSNATVAQSDPYGPVDPLEASVSVLRRSIGGAGSPANINELADFDLPGFVSILQAGVTNPSPPLRVRAAIGLAAAGEPIPLLLSRLDSADERSSLIIGAFSKGLLDPSIAGTIADHDDAKDVALAILLALADRASDAERLSRLAADPDTAWLTRGIAAATLEQRGTSALEGWFEAISKLTPAEHDRNVFEMLATVDLLGFDIAIERMPPLIGPRPSNDAIRAALVESLLELAPEAGIPAWNSMLADCPEDGQIAPIGMLLVSAGQPAPIEAKNRFPSEDRMSKALRELIFAAPDQRPQASIAAIELGHRPTMIWAMAKAEEMANLALLEAIFDAAARSRRRGIEPFAIRASQALATAAPSVLGRRLVDQEDRAIIEFIFRGLIAAGTPEAAAEARPYLGASDRTTRSLALLAVARAGDLDDAQRRLLGRAAAGGGGLPQDLRPLAAWLFLKASGELKNSIPRIVEP